MQKFQLGVKMTRQAIEILYDLVVLAATVAAIVKLAVQPHVHTAIAALPIWQCVAAVLLAGIAVHEYRLRRY